MPGLSIIILNFRNAPDTIACVDSVLAAYGHDVDVSVVVVDNDSQDGSFEAICERYAPGTAPGSTPVPRVRRWVQQERLLLVQSEENGGFAYGNNVGLLAAARFAPAFYWILNNDTAISPGTREAFAEAHAWYEAHGQRVGLIGQKLVSYDDPTVLQAIGARLDRWTLQARHIGAGERDRGQYDDYRIAEQMDYPVGASLYFSHDFLQDVGLMREDYFLYYEELDWLEKAHRRGWCHGFMWQVPLRHREGGTIRSDAGGRKYSPVADYFAIVSRLRFAWWNCPGRLPTAALFCLFILLQRLLAGSWRSVWLVLRLRNPVRSRR